MGVEYDGDKLDEIYRLVRENNRMLKSMRRSAFIGGLVRFVVWIALILIPLWLYMQYVAPVMQGMLEAMSQIQGTGANAQAQFGELSDALQKLQQQFPQFFPGN